MRPLDRSAIHDHDDDHAIRSPVDRKNLKTIGFMSAVSGVCSSRLKRAGDSR